MEASIDHVSMIAVSHEELASRISVTSNADDLAESHAVRPPLADGSTNIMSRRIPTLADAALQSEFFVQPVPSDVSPNEEQRAGSWVRLFSSNRNAHFLLNRTTRQVLGASSVDETERVESYPDIEPDCSWCGRRSVG
jgi:hypothetical protein